ncbi:MAG: murein L,D-transpeptidase catalytic domain family protein [Flavitalea sp.]
MRCRLLNGTLVSALIVVTQFLASTATAADSTSVASAGTKKFKTSYSPVAPFTAAAAVALYDSLNLRELGLNQKVFLMAVRGMEKLRKMGRLTNDRVLSIVDFSQPSVNKRLYMIDLLNGTLLYNTLVAHGMKSGKEKAMVFSNKVSSNKSSLGFYVTSQTYNGNNGYSLRLMGCEKGFNDNAARRAIVVHGADYVNEDWISSQGYIGRSQGCPALPPAMSKEMIDEMKDGSCLFIYSPNKLYLSTSKLVK